MSINKNVLIVVSAFAVMAAYIADKTDIIWYSIIDNIFYFAVALFVVSVCLYFASQDVLISWSKLAVWFLPLSLLIVFSISENEANILSGLTGREPVAIALSGIFLLVSLILIAYKTFVKGAK